ncbi:uncharacterized protein [Antedon mediterranea]|uniref:uncharacterized protein n=1 Tax=Antedon mediterranea TaxID=105859 RepID=UPI003AF6092A
MSAADQFSTEKFQKGYYHYKGIKFHMMMLPPGNLDAMATFEVRPDDIFLVTYAKCGTHWSYEIINLILNGGDPDKIDRTCQEAPLEMSYIKDKTDMKSFEPFYKKIEAKKGQRVILTHLPESLLPPQVFTKKPKVRFDFHVIYVTRNPKDCGVSLYHATKGVGMTAHTNWSTFVDEWIKQEDILLGGFFTHVLDYWKHRHDSNFLYMKYEDMKRDPRGSVTKFADHLERCLTDEELDNVVHYSDVKNMKKTYDNVEKNVKDGVFLTKAMGKSSFIRKGQIGDWKNHFTVAQNEQFEAKIRENLHGTGLVFDFFKMSAAEQFSTEMFQKGYYHYKGIKFHTMVFPVGNLDAMPTFEVRPDDIFLVTYAKCGTHWSNEIINLILTGGDPDKIDRSCQEAALEMSYIKDKTDIKSLAPFYKKLEAIEGQRVILTHLQESLLPPQVFTKKPKVIYVTRNPKDCGVSLYHANNKIGVSALDATWNTFADEWIKQEDLLMGGFFTHALEYWKHRHDSNFLYMKYEDMKKDPKGSVTKFANHLERTLTDEELDKVVHYSDVKNMKKTYDDVEKKVKDGVFLTKAVGKSPFIRKGQIGDWKNHFTVAQNEQFDAKIRENLHGTGLAFDFE